jgi:hypothetical protein
MVGWILSEQRGAAKPSNPLAAGHDTAIFLSNHVYWIQDVLLRKLSIEEGCLTIKQTLPLGLFHRLHDE